MNLDYKSIMIIKYFMTKQNHNFNAEISKVLSLVIDHIYTNEDIFLRELISNSSDACDKLRYMIASGEFKMEENAENNSSEAAEENSDELTQEIAKTFDFACNDLKIWIEVQKENRKIIIRDNGIGMSKDELIENLGTIARSGTQQFLEALKDKNNDLIGQFGVGFYSAFIIADNVEVISRRANSDEKWRWTSDGKESFDIEEYNDNFERGTQIILNVKESQDKYLDRFKLENIISLYSDHVKFPIELMSDDGKFNQVNESAAIWKKSKDEISSDDYKKFFTSIAGVAGEPWMTLHNRNEGIIEYTNLLFIPSMKPFDLFNPDRRCTVKLYVKQVFITEDNANVIPRHLRFVKGIVDSEDLPLNINRENLQHNSVIDRIRSALTKKILSELKKKMSENFDDYCKFWNNFGAVLKEGLCEPLDNDSRAKLLDTCLFHSFNKDKLISLDQYIENQKENQNTIFYITGTDQNVLKKSPQLEGFIKREIDVLLLSDAVDDFYMTQTQDYKNIKFQSATDSEVDLNKIVYLKEDDEDSDESTDETKKEKEDYNQKIQTCFTEKLGSKISKVIISKKLTNSPICIANESGKMNARLERFMMEQNQLHQKSAKTIEVNPNHEIVKNLINKYDANPENPEVHNIAYVLFTQACMIEGDAIDDTSEYVKIINDLLKTK